MLAHRHLQLRPFLDDQLVLVRGWFEHPEVRRRLGGPEWPERALRLQQQPPQDEAFRGSVVLRSHTWLAWDHDIAVGFLGGDVYERWTTWDGTSVTASEPGPAMGAAYVVDPARWRQGYGVGMLRAWNAAPEVAEVRILGLGIDEDNEASARCAAAAGFTPVIAQPDREDTVYYLLRR